MTVTTQWSDIRLSAADWAVAFEAAPGIPHNEARDQILEELVTILVDRDNGDVRSTFSGTPLCGTVSCSRYSTVRGR